jgi:NADPH-dependent 2,4-dienoyl-CoA reductase/sulfur reductase-like enzyme
MAEPIAITVNGQTIATSTNCSVAAAVLPTQNAVLRRSVTGEPRGPICGMGICFECRVTINGDANQRSCQMPCTAGLNVETSNDAVPLAVPTPIHTERAFDVLVIGGGPAGLAAARAAAQLGQRVGIVDDNPNIGGQIWRADATRPVHLLHDKWLRGLPVEVLTQTQIHTVATPRTLLAATSDAVCTLRCQRLILACGARERFLPFPGWTLPGVFGAGGLQALVKAGHPIENRRVVVAGTGPLLLAVAAYLRRRGAQVRLIAEQTPRGKLVRFAGSLLWRQPSKLAQAFGLGWQLRGVPFHAGCWPVHASGTDRLESITLTDGTRTWTEPCDALACGFGLTPNLELPIMLGCAHDGGFVSVDAHQQSSIPDVFAVGEITGIGGLEKAILEGQIAGSGQANSTIAKARTFVDLLDQTFALRDELRRLARDSTIVCRCEDVTFGRLRRHANWRDAKLQTRGGMGPCQGRVCGPAVHFLFGWTNDSVRPPILPTKLSHLAAAEK